MRTDKKKTKEIYLYIWLWYSILTCLSLDKTDYVPKLKTFRKIKTKYRIKVSRTKRTIPESKLDTHQDLQKDPQRQESKVPVGL